MVNIDKNNKRLVCPVGRPKLEDGFRRNDTITFRITHDEYIKLKSFCEGLSITPSSFCRDLILKKIKSRSVFSIVWGVEEVVKQKKYGFKIFDYVFGIFSIGKKGGMNDDA